MKRKTRTGLVKKTVTLFLPAAAWRVIEKERRRQGYRTNAEYVRRLVFTNLPVLAPRHREYAPPEPQSGPQPSSPGFMG